MWLSASSYMGKYLRISSYIRKPFLIYDFATAPRRISLYMRKIFFSFLSVYSRLWHMVVVPTHQPKIDVEGRGGGEKGLWEKEGVEKREGGANIGRKMPMKEGKKDCPSVPSPPSKYGTTRSLPETNGWRELPLISARYLSSSLNWKSETV